MSSAKLGELTASIGSSGGFDADDEARPESPIVGSVIGKPLRNQPRHGKARTPNLESDSSHGTIFIAQSSGDATTRAHTILLFRQFNKSKRAYTTGPLTIRRMVPVRPPPCGCRVIVELFTAAAPLACENFLRLCRGAEPAPGTPQALADFIDTEIKRWGAAVQRTGARVD
jgi:hypothetical protein